MPSDGQPTTSAPRTRADRLAFAVVPRPDVTLHILEQQGVLFDASRQSAYTVNATGTFIWCCLEREMQPAEIVLQLQQTFSLPPACADDYVRRAIHDWCDLDLVVAGPPADRITDIWPDAQSRGDERASALAALPTGQRRVRHGQSYVLLDLIFGIRVSAPTLRTEIDLLLSPLALDSPSRYTVRLDLIEDANGFSVRREGRPYASCARLDQAVPLIKSCLVEQALGRSGDFGAIHAAALSRNGSCILLVGPSGAGKSTLTAALVAAGFELMADDTTVLARDSLEARPVPFAICLKEGAWELLRSRFPDLGRRPIHDRLDGKKVRYLLPTSGYAWAKPTARRRVTGLVFLNRVPQARSSLQSIDRADALGRLAKEFCPLGEGLTAQKMEQLVNWIGAVDCLELRYSPLDDGVERLTKLRA